MAVGFMREFVVLKKMGPPLALTPALAHVSEEAFDPGQHSHLDKASAWLWTFFKRRSSAPPLPSDFFDDSGYGPNPIPPPVIAAEPMP